MSKIVKGILRVAVGIVQLAVSLVVIMSLISAVNVVMNQDLAAIIGGVDINIDPMDPSTNNFTLPLVLDNSEGLHDIDDLTINMQLRAYNITNTSESYPIFNETESFNLAAGDILNELLYYGNTSFTWDPDLIAGFIANSSAYMGEFFLDISANYKIMMDKITIPFGFNATMEMVF